jgi:hypothetical protein
MTTVHLSITITRKSNPSRTLTQAETTQSYQKIPAAQHAMRSITKISNLSPPRSKSKYKANTGIATPTSTDRNP